MGKKTNKELGVSRLPEMEDKIDNFVLNPSVEILYNVLIELYNHDDRTFWIQKNTLYTILYWLYREKES